MLWKANISSFRDRLTAIRPNKPLRQTQKRKVAQVIAGRKGTATNINVAFNRNRTILWSVNTWNPQQRLHCTGSNMFTWSVQKVRFVVIHNYHSCSHSFRLSSFFPFCIHWHSSSIKHEFVHPWNRSKKVSYPRRKINLHQCQPCGCVGESHWEGLGQ